MDDGHGGVVSDPPAFPDEASASSEPVDDMASADGSATISRREAAKVLGVDERTVRRMAQDGRLKPVAQPGGTLRFLAEEVREVTVHRRVANRVTVGEPEDGELAAELFVLFDEGAGPVEAVKRLRVPPRVVSDVYRQWVELRGGIFVLEKSVQELCAQLPIEAPLRDGEHLVKAILRAWPGDKCTECKREVPEVCVACARTISIADAQKRELAAQLERQKRQVTRDLSHLRFAFQMERRRRAVSGRNPKAK